MSYRLVIVEPAEFDVDYIYRYIRERSPQGAGSWYRAFDRCLARIVHRPFSCSLAPEDSKFAFEIRQAMFKTRYGDPYRCVFTVADNEVRVLRVRGRGQPPLEKKALLNNSRTGATLIGSAWTTEADAGRKQPIRRESNRLLTGGRSVSLDVSQKLKDE